MLSGYKVLGSMAKHHKCDGAGRRGGEEGGERKEEGEDEHRRRETFHPSPQEAKVSGSLSIQGQPSLHRE